MTISTAVKNATLDAILGDDASSVWPGSWWASLNLGDPLDSGTEVSAGEYARVEIVNDSTSWPAATSAIKTLAVPVVWPTVVAGWGAPNWVGLHDAATAGVCWWSTPIIGGPVADLAAGTVPALGPGSLSFTYRTF